MADGTITWMTGPRTLESHIIPAVTAAATSAGRPSPMVVAQFPVCVTDDVAAAREQAAHEFAFYATLPSYKSMLEKEGVDGPSGVAIIGDEDAVREQISHLESIGVTEFGAQLFGSTDQIERSKALLGTLVAARDH